MDHTSIGAYHLNPILQKPSIMSNLYTQKEPGSSPIAQMPVSFCLGPVLSSLQAHSLIPIYAFISCGNSVFDSSRVVKTRFVNIKEISVIIT
jgi:hypothetical protein